MKPFSVMFIITLAVWIFAIFVANQFGILLLPMVLFVYGAVLIIDQMMCDFDSSLHRKSLRRRGEIIKKTRDEAIYEILKVSIGFLHLLPTIVLMAIP